MVDIARKAHRLLRESRFGLLRARNLNDHSCSIIGQLVPDYVTSLWRFEEVEFFVSGLSAGTYTDGKPGDYRVRLRGAARRSLGIRTC
jgi:hypothetical protein